MHLVVVHGWKQEASEVAKTIAETMGCLAFEDESKGRLYTEEEKVEED